jgi:dihydrofolate synthase / folylpolyglutamate synthase
MNYSEAIQFLFDQLPMFQRSGPSAYKDNLDNTLQLDAYFNHPHRRFKTIHVGGTNGKGSVSHMIASILQAAGYRTGLYTSPHLLDFRERIRINGMVIPEEEVTRFVVRHSQIIQSLLPSFFEMTVAMAFDYFAAQEVDVAVVEVGLGGRLDSTNIISPQVSVITNIGMDHMSILGNTLVAIAREKAGIIKPGVPVVVGQHQAEVAEVFRAVAAACQSTLIEADEIYNARLLKRMDGFQVLEVARKGQPYLEVHLPLLGNYQQHNVPTVLAAMEQLGLKGFKVTRDNLLDGLANVVGNTGLRGRWELLGLNPRIICDTGHNEDGIRAVVQQIQETPYERLHMILGMVRDKSIDAILQLLPEHATYYFTRADIPRSLDANDLKSAALDYGLKGEAYGSVAAAFASAKKNAGINDLIFIGGSTFVVAEVI